MSETFVEPVIVKIIGMNIVTPKPWTNGDRLLAFFDCEVRGFQLSGCLLIRTAKNGFIAQPPRAENYRGSMRSIRFLDSQLQAHIMDAARRAYVAFGGKDGEWTPRQESAGDKATTEQCPRTEQKAA